MCGFVPEGAAWGQPHRGDASVGLGVPLWGHHPPSTPKLTNLWARCALAEGAFTEVSCAGLMDELSGHGGLTQPPAPSPSSSGGGAAFQPCLGLGLSGDQPPP